MSSRRYAVLFAMICAIPLRAHAGTFVFDDFEDGDYQDGVPATWMAGPRDSLQIQNGHLVVSSDDGFARANLSFAPLVNTSIRTQLRLNLGDSMGVAARYYPGAGSVTNYYAFVDTLSSEVGIGLGGSATVVTAVLTDIDVTQEDMILQMDVFGDRIDLWVWRPGEEMPASPVTSYMSDLLSFGGIFLWVANSGSVSGAFEFIHVADAHIIDPTPDADYDGDDNVDGRDLVEWQRGESPNPYSQEDLGAWQARYGEGATLVGNVDTVPEPETAVVLASALVSLRLSRRGRQVTTMLTSRHKSTRQGRALFHRRQPSLRHLIGPGPPRFSRP